ncbi:MAG: hypothetical protein GF332_00410 [Candidatus Moranbacteria bacterium]|nr:hypothetical protein [Candidatus Moranbacteria bacterium]
MKPNADLKIKILAGAFTVLILGISIYMIFLNIGNSGKKDQKISSIFSNTFFPNRNQSHNQPVDNQIPTTSNNKKFDKIIYVSVNGAGLKDGSSKENATSSIQKALDQIKPGEKIELAAGNYFENLETKIHGTREKPIYLSGPKQAQIRGKGEKQRIFQIFHDYYVLDGFTINGYNGEGDSKENYQDKLLYVHGQLAPYQGRSKRGPTGLEIKNMRFLNAGGECIRLRYFVTQANIHHNNIENCGLYDFVFDEDGKNGEGIYIGTSSEQWEDGKNPTTGPDESHDNWIHHNTINTQGNECVEMKEGSYNNLIEYNTCTGGKDKESGGLTSRGNHNIFKDNLIFSNKGCGIRFGGHKEDGEKYGIKNHAYNNTIYDNDYCGIKFMREKQGKVCNNIFIGPNGEDQDDITRGEYAEEYRDRVEKPCD